jgi:hypothetical protein
MLYKACGGDVSKWWWFLPHVLWADHISIRKRLGCLPFFMVTGVHPTIPLDVTEATWLVELPDHVLTDDELIGFRARALTKHKMHVDEMHTRVSKAKIKWLLWYEKDHKAVLVLTKNDVALSFFPQLSTHPAGLFTQYDSKTIV